MQEKQPPFFRQPQPEAQQPLEEKPKRNKFFSFTDRLFQHQSSDATNTVQNAEFFANITPKPDPNAYKNGPNLIFHDEKRPYNAEFLKILSASFYKASLLTLGIFIAVVIANAVLTLNLLSSRALINSMAMRLEPYTSVKKAALDVEAKIKFYEKTLSSRALMGNRASMIFSNLGPSVQLRSANVNLNRFTIDVVISSPLEFAKLTSRYLDNDLITSITLKSAELDAPTGNYKVIMEGIF
jgi:hypothetical protein